MFLGPDEDGTLLEVMAVQTEEGQMARAQETPRTRRGTIITDEVADELAREAETGYDLSKATRVGRRSLAGGSGRSPRLNFRTTEDLYERATARAESEGKTVSQIARDALERYVTPPEQ